MLMTGADMILKGLEKNGVSVIFGYPGAANCPIYDKIPEYNIQHILVRNEQGAAHMANAYARVTGKVGVCTATSGPGATNLITGIATAYMDSIPLVAITGQVDTSLIGRDAFQEVDITGTTISVCKHNYLVEDIKDLPRIIDEAVYIATTGRPGPVLVDVPMNISLSSTDCNYDFSCAKPPVIRGYNPEPVADKSEFDEIVTLLKTAKRPLILSGGGIILSKASDAFRNFIKTSKIPVVSTMTGIGSIETDNRLYYGMVGSHGVRVANYALNKSDVLLVLGARLGDRAVAHLTNLKTNKKIIHIDIDPAEICKNIAVDISVISDAGFALQQLNSHAGKISCPDEWVADLDRVKSMDKPYNTDDGEFVNPKYLLKKLSDRTNSDVIITTEVGQNQIWTANAFTVKNAGSFITSAGFGTMGYGLPAAIGAKFAAPDKTVIAVMGDGSFQMDMCELGTMSQWGINVKMILFKNNRLGMVRELQWSAYKSNYSGVFLDGSPDFAKLVDAYGIKSKCISKNSEIDSAIDALLSDDKSFLLIVNTDPLETCQVGFDRKEHENE